MRICQYKPCSKEITGRPDKKFCCKLHRTYHSHGDNIQVNHMAMQKQQTVIKNAPRCVIYIVTCPISHILFIGRRNTTVFHPSVSVEDRSKYTYTPLPKDKRVCGSCGVGYEAHRSKHGYCLKCTDMMHRRNLKHKRRVRIRAVYEKVDHIKVFNACNWHCMQCGCNTPKDKRGTTAHNAPELDHIIPLSKGGSHTYVNTQLLCRKCNSIKSDNITTEYNFV